MPNFNPEIFKAYDIRGIYGRDFDDDFAFKLGAALVLYLKRRRFLVALDDRPSSSGLAESFARGVVASGGDVELFGRAATPFFNFAFGELAVDGGVMVTASHNTAEYGGFKVFGDGGRIIGLESGLDKIKSIILENQQKKDMRYV